MSGHGTMAGRTIEPPSVTENWQGLLGLFMVYGIGAGLVAAHVVYALDREATAREVVTVGAAPLLLVAGMAYAAYWLRKEGVGGPIALRIGAWTSLVSLFLGGAAWLMIGNQEVAGGQFVDPTHTILGWTTAGAVLGLLVGLYDGNLQLAAAEARRAREKTERLNQRLTVLNRVLRHDIRNGVNMIIGHAETVLDDGGDPEEHLESIRNVASEVHSISEGARALEDVVAGGAATKKRIDLASVVGRQVDRIDDEFPEVTVARDLVDTAPVYATELLAPAVGNLIENAARHNDSDDPRVTVSLGPTPDARYRLEVTDNGPGIPDHIVEVIDSDDETPLEHSRGLGLWLVRWAVTESGGTLSFDESPSGGSVVRIEVPVAEE